MSGSGYDYGSAGIVGIGTPQANPTVEAEMRVLLPANVLPVVVRLTSAATGSSDRLRDYLLNLEDTLSHFDTLRPAVFGFACTGSSYLVPRDDQQQLIARIESKLGYPVVTATDAIAWRLKKLGARRIALASPYPSELADAAERFWTESGFDVVQVRRIDTGNADTRGIYTLGSQDAQPAADALRALDIDAVLLSGTGMPSLPLIAAAQAGPPLLSSNLCLAERLCSVANIEPAAPQEWGSRLSAAITPSAQGASRR